MHLNEDPPQWETLVLYRTAVFLFVFFLIWGGGGVEKLIFTLEHKRVNCIPERGMIFLFSWNVSAVVQAQEN